MSSLAITRVQTRSESGSLMAATVGFYFAIRYSFEYLFFQANPRAGAAFSVGHVQPAKPHDAAIAEFNIETLINVDHLHVSGRPPARRKAGGRENDGRERHASSADPASGVGERCAAAVRKAKIHAKGMPRLALPCP